MLGLRGEIFKIKNPQRICDQKLIEELEIQIRWLKYASFVEDKEIWQDKWNVKYDNVREIFWDNTNIDFLFKPSTALLQKISYSQYYAHNCANGGGFVQPCGWLGTE